MASIYSNIKTARELIEDVAAHGISMDVDDICTAQDIFGHCTESELQALARSKESIGTKTVKSVFYFTLFEIWDWQDAVKFWNKTSNRDHEIMMEQGNELEELHRKVEAMQKLVDSLKKERDDKWEEAKLLKEKLREAQMENAGNEMEVQRLKAKLFDLMEQQKAG